VYGPGSTAFTGTGLTEAENRNSSTSTGPVRSIGPFTTG
jgi:hypothetical protein